MSAQLNYGFATPKSVAGGIYDLAPYAVDTFLCEDEIGTMLPGMGVIAGTKAGIDCKVGNSGLFLGVATNNRTREYDMEGKIYIRKGDAVGVMRHGRIWVKVASTEETTMKYGAKAYLKADGTFTSVASGAVAVNALFMSAADAANEVALVEIFNDMPTVE